MGEQRVPEKLIHICDGCGLRHEYEEGARPFNGKPLQWTKIVWTREAHDFQGNAVADASIHLILCSGCSTSLGNAINVEFAGHRSMKEKGDSV